MTVVVSPVSDVDLLLSLAGQFAGDEDVRSVSRQWLANGPRGVRHLRHGSTGQSALCSSFSARPSARLIDASIDEVRRGPCCEDCLTALASSIAGATGAMSVALLTLDFRAVDLLSRLEGVSVPPSGLVRLRGEVSLLLRQLEQYLSNADAVSLPARVTVGFIDQLRSAQNALTARLASAGLAVHAEAVRVAMVPPVDGASWLAQDWEFRLLGFDPDMGESGPRMVLARYAQALAEGVDADEARQEAVVGLTVRGLRSLGQLERVPVGLVAVSSADRAAQVDPEGQESGVTLGALRDAWTVQARLVASAMVDRWDSRRRELEAATSLVRVVLVSRVDPDRWDELVQVACASSLVFGPVFHHDRRAVVVEVTQATAQALLSRVSDAGERLGAFFGGVLPDGLDDRQLDTALALWTPWEPGEEFTQLDAAVASARALVGQAPAASRAVRVPVGRSDAAPRAVV